MNQNRIFKALALTGAIGAVGWAFVVPAPAMAQDLAGMSCNELWYARNQIYARNGYCFRTARARAVFGAGCFPPYGQLSGWERSRVNQIQMWEGRNGC